MYLFLGEDTAKISKKIIGIFDMDTSTVNKATRDFLNNAEKTKKVKYVNYELPKSFVVTDDFVYISPVNTSTLLKRAKENGKKK